MAPKRSSRRPSETRAVTTERTARLYRLLQLLASGPQSRASLIRQLRCDVRSFYRDLKLLREIGFAVPLQEQRYRLDGELTEAVAARMPFPDPDLTLAEAQQLARGNGAAQRKLREQINRILPATGAKKPKLQ
jgi:predicted DNA-binding transcriptional regulator YafY